MTHHTDKLIHSFQQRTEAILQKAILEWQMLPSENLTTPPAPGQWSVAQCLEHLNFYGQHYLPAIDSAIRTAKQQGSQPDKMFRPGLLGAYFTELMLPQQDGRLKKKMASPKNARPSVAPDPTKMLAKFIEQQERLLQLLEAARAVNLNKIRVPTSLSPLIRLKLGDTFGFLIAHLERHVLQAERSLLHTSRLELI